MDRRFRAVAAVVIALGIFVAIAAAAGRYFFEPDESKYGRVACEMARTGDRLVPRLVDEFYTAKPAGYFWLMEAAGKIVGTESALHGVLPAALSMALLAWLLFALKKDREPLFGPLSAVLLATCPIGFGAAAACRMDAPFALLIVASILLGAGPPAFERPRLLLAGGLAGLAVVIKGPYGILIPAATLAAFWVFERRRPPLLDLAAGVLACVVVAGAWMVPALIAGGEGYRRELFGQVADAAVSTRKEIHPYPWWYYLRYLPMIFAPWALILPQSITEAWRRRDAWDRLLLAWFIVPFVILSCVKGKLAIYLLPILPAGAILVARTLLSTSPGASIWRFRAWLSIPAAALAAAGLAASAAAFQPGLMPADLMHFLSKWGITPRDFAIPGAILAALGIFLLVAAVRGRARFQPIAWSLLPPLAIVASWFAIFPALQAVRAHDPLGMEFRRAVRPGQPLVAISLKAPAIAHPFRAFPATWDESAFLHLQFLEIPIDPALYAYRPFRNGRLEEPLRVLARAPGGAWLVVTDPWLPEIRRIAPRVRIVGTGRHRSFGITLLFLPGPGEAATEAPRPGP